MNLDALSYSEEIQLSARRVRISEKGGRWMLLGYVDKGKEVRLMTVNIEKQGTIWCELLGAFQDDKIQYGYVKLDLEAKGNTKLILIHWTGEKVSEDEKLSCKPHLNEIRNLIPNYDLLVKSMDTLDIQSKVHNFLCRTQSVSVNTNPPKIDSVTLEVSSNIKDQRKETKKLSTLEKWGIHRSGTLQHEKMRSESFTSYITPTLNLHKLPLPKVKVAIIGRSGVGKTYIYSSYNGGGRELSGPQGGIPTIGADFMNKDVMFDERDFTLEIWDTAGQERFVTFMSVWTRNAKVVICVYDITDEESFYEIPKLLQAARDYADSKAIFFLVGNKADLVHRREVRETDGERVATQHGMIFMECSGLTGLNILKLFEDITKQVVSVYEDIFTFNPLMSRLPYEQMIQLRECDEYEYTTQYKKRNGSCQRCK